MCLPAGVLGKFAESLTIRTAKSIKRPSSSSARDWERLLFISFFHFSSIRSAAPLSNIGPPLKSMKNKKYQMINGKCSCLNLHFSHHTPRPPEEEPAQQGEGNRRWPHSCPTTTTKKRVANHIQVVTHRHKVRQKPERLRYVLYWKNVTSKQK